MTILSQLWDIFLRDMNFIEWRPLTIEDTEKLPKYLQKLRGNI